MGLTSLFGSDGGSQPTVVDVEIDDALHILRVSRRRAVIRHLVAVEDEIELRELARVIAGDELSKPPVSVNSDEYKRVYVGLYQSYLPDMDDLGIVEYNEGPKTVAPGEKLNDFHHLLEVIETRTGGSTA